MTRGISIRPQSTDASRHKAPVPLLWSGSARKGLSQLQANASPFCPPTRPLAYLSTQQDYSGDVVRTTMLLVQEENVCWQA